MILRFAPVRMTAIGVPLHRWRRGAWNRGPRDRWGSVLNVGRLSARVEEESMMTRDRSIRSAARNFASKISCR